MPETPDPTRQLAAKLNGQVWTLLDKPERTARENLEMRDAAHGSLALWRHVGGPVNWQRGAWLIGRVYLVQGRLDMAEDYSAITTELTHEHATDMQDFDLVYELELSLRLKACRGQGALAKVEFPALADRAKAVSGAKDKEILLGDIAAGPWGALDVTWVLAQLRS